MRIIHKHNGKLLDLVNNFNGKKVLVVGDIILDRYMFGDVLRISPEAPIPIVTIDNEKYVPGGASNSANNIASLGGNAFLVGVIGNDEMKEKMHSILKLNKINSDGLVVDDSRPTILKTRVVAQNQQLLRIDNEKIHFISEDIENQLIGYIKKNINQFGIIVISDYGKGVVTKSLARQLIIIAHQTGKKVIVDPKQKDPEFYHGAYLITPNIKEASEITKMDPKSEEDITLIGKKLLLDLGANILITRGKDGMTLCQEKEIVHVPTKAREVYDVSGAGDTVIATIALALVAGADLVDAVVLANYAAGIVVGKFGTATTNVQELKKYIEEESKGHET